MAIGMSETFVDLPVEKRKYVISISGFIHLLIMFGKSESLEFIFQNLENYFSQIGRKKIQEIMKST